jgi:Ca-activated chloride channel family protein
VIEGFRFQEPLWLWLALAGPLVVIAGWLRERSLRALFFPGAGRLHGRWPGWRARLRHLPLLCAAAGLCLGAVAQARPQQGSEREDVTTQGVDIVIALDVSGSMGARDFQPRNRIEVAKDVVADFVRRRPRDRIGLVVFAGRSLTQAPPTTDVGILLHQLESVKLDMLPDGTAIGSGLATCLTRLRRSEAKSRIVVLVTDGANNTGEIDPKTAADLAKAMQVRVYTIGVGREGLVPMPVRMRDPRTGQIVEEFQMQESDLDEGLLGQIAERTGGEFFRAVDSESLQRIFGEIDRLERSEIQLRRYTRYRELYHPVLGLAGALLALGGTLWLAGLRVAPA